VKNPLEGAVVGSVIETNIEVDREFKVTKAQKAFLSTIKVGICLHILEVMKTTRLNLMQSLSRIMN
jgi:hypothetical protein